MGGSAEKYVEKKKTKKNRGLDAEDERHCGGLEQISAGKQLFRVHCGSFGAISEQRAAGAWRVCKWIDELASRARYKRARGETEPCHYLEMSYTSSPRDPAPVPHP